MAHEPAEGARTPPPETPVAAALSQHSAAPGATKDAAASGGTDNGAGEAPPAPPVIKYMHPANRKMVWSGEGEQPEWVTAYLAGGGSWTALANAAEKLAPWGR